jgi:hypothetical protein
MWKGGKRDGSYRLFVDGRANGAFENHRDGLGVEKWKADAAAILSPAERAELRAKTDRQRRERIAERTRDAEEAAHANITHLAVKILGNPRQTSSISVILWRSMSIFDKLRQTEAFAPKIDIV